MARGPNTFLQGLLEGTISEEEKARRIAEASTTAKAANAAGATKVNETNFESWPKDIKRRYENSLKHIRSMRYTPAKEGTKQAAKAKAVDEFVSQAEEQLTRDFILIASGTASSEEIAAAVSSIEQITGLPRNVGEDPVFKSWKEGGQNAAWFDSRERQTLTDQRSAAKELAPGGSAAWATSDKVNAARRQEGKPVHPDVGGGGGSGVSKSPTEGGTVGDTKKLFEQTQPEYIDELRALELITPEREAKRKLGEEELISDRGIEELQSVYGDDPFAFRDRLDPTGEQAQKDAIGYYRDLVEGGGRDAVSDAMLNRAQQEAEQNRRSAVQAELSRLGTMGRSTGGAALQATLQGAGQSMAQQYNASLDAAAQAQQRKDAAAAQMAGLGFNLRNQQFSEVAHAGASIDAMTQQRANLMAQIDEVNSGRQYATAEQYAQMQQNLNILDAQIKSAQNEYNTQVQNQEIFARNRAQEGFAGQEQATLANALQADATRTAQAIAQKLGLDATRQQAFVQAVANADNFDLQKRIIDKQLEESGTSLADIAGAILPLAGAGVGGLLGGQTGAGVGGAVGSAVSAGFGGTPSGASGVPYVAKAFENTSKPQAQGSASVGFQPVAVQYNQPTAVPTAVPGAAGPRALDDF